MSTMDLVDGPFKFLTKIVATYLIKTKSFIIIVSVCIGHTK